MKHIITTALALVLVGSFTSAQAQEEKKKERPPLTEEQKALMKQMNEKYDANKDGRIDQEERAKISPEDREKMQKAGIGRGPGGGKGGKEGEKGKGEEKKKKE
ncbi:MAG TPA: hypothetical protein VGH19_02280 [Verrucomicrobiae bacterium]